MGAWYSEVYSNFSIFLRQFQTRVSRQTLLGLEASPDKDMDLLEAAEPQRSSLVDLKGRGKKNMKAPVSRVGDALKCTLSCLHHTSLLEELILSVVQFVLAHDN